MYYSNRKFNNRKPKFAITDTNSYVPVMTFSVQDNEKILQQLKRGFKKQKRNQKKTIFKPLTWSKFLRSKKALRFIIWNVMMQKLQAIFSSDCKNKRLQCYDWWKKFFRSASKKCFHNIWKHSKDSNWSRRLLHNWLLARLQLF